MLNMIIIDDDIYYAKKLMDYINESNDDIRVCNIALDGKEGLELLNNSEKIDIFLLDLKMPIYTGIEILDKLNEDKKNKYKKSCIVISGEINMFKHIIGNNIIYSYMYKCCEFKYIVDKINSLIKSKNELQENTRLREKIVNELNILHFNTSYLGTKYLKECIYYIMKDMNNNFENLKKEVYPKIANKYNKTMHNIKCNINSAVNAMYFDCESQVIIEYFNFTKDFKPTAKLIINTIINKIENKE